MASVTILSDNGATSGSAGLKTSGGNDGVLLLQTTTSGGTPTTAISISNTQVVTYTNQPTYTGGTANGVLYLNGSKAVTSGTALSFNGTDQVTLTGSSTVAVFRAVSPTNGSAAFQFGKTNGYALGFLESNNTWFLNYDAPLGTGSYQVFRGDSTGHVILGAGTFASWISSQSGFQLGQAGSVMSTTNANYIQMSNNWYQATGGADSFLRSGYAQRYVLDQNGNALVQISSASGTAGGAITWNTQLTATASGNVIAGTNPSAGAGRTPLTAYTATGSSKVDVLSVQSTAGSGAQPCLTFDTYGNNSNVLGRISAVDVGSFGGSLVFEYGPTKGTGSTTTNEGFRMNSSGGINVNTTNRGGTISGANDTVAGQIFVTNAGTTWTTPDNGSGASFYAYNSSTAAGATANLTLRCNTSTSYGAYIALDVNGVAGWGVGVRASNQNFYINNSWATINGGNGVYLTQGSPSTWQTFSDERLKTIVRPIEGALEKVKKIRKVIGYYNTDKGKTLVPFFIAQDFLEVLPEVVDNSDEKGYGMSYQGTIPLLAAAIEELAKELEALKGQA